MLKFAFAAAVASLVFAAPLSASAAQRHAHHRMHQMMVMVKGQMAPVYVMMNGHMEPVMVDFTSANGS